MKKSAILISVGIVIGILMGSATNNTSAWTQVPQSWTKDKVLAIVLVKPSFGSFVPTDGNSIGVSWSKGETVPVCLVKPSIGGFVPLGESSIGVAWTEGDVKPFVLVEPSLGGFALSQSPPVAFQSPAASTGPATSRTGRGSCDPAIETHIDGEFNGWDEETIYRMDDGSIWQQSNYHYHYHYAYHPSVLIFPGHAGLCHVKVEGDEDDGVDVIRIK